jgi:hypothetical protein
MQNLQFQIRSSIEELRQSPYHQQLGRNVCAAFIAQQQGTRMDTASKKIEEPVGDLWLLVAEIIRQQCFEGALCIEASVLADSASKKDGSLAPRADCEGLRTMTGECTHREVISGD